MAPSRRVIVAIAIITCTQIGSVSFHLLSRASGTGSALVGLPLDDAWIHLVYARNIAERFEIAYNPGEPEVGLTSPLWALLLSPASTLDGHGPAVAAKCLSALFAIFTCLLLALLARKLLGDIAGLAAGLATALDPQLAFSAASGMEVALASSLIVATLLATCHRRVALAGILLGLAWLARPESMAIVIVMIPWTIVLKRRDEISWRQIGLGAGAVVCAIVPFSLYCLEVTGRPLPNTFYIKSHLDLVPIDGLWVLARGVLLGSIVTGLGVGAVVALGGLRWLFREKSPDHLGVAAAPIVLLLAVLMSRSFVAGEEETYYYTRYLHPVLALLMVWVGCGFGALLAWRTKVERAKKGSRKKSRQRSRTKKTYFNHAQVLPAAVIVAFALTVALWLPSSAARFSWNTQNIEEMQVAAGLWIARETPEDAVIAASDAGAVRFFGDRRVIDLMALNYHEGVETRQQDQIPLGLVMREERPTHLAILPSWFPNIERGGRARAVFVGRAARYTIAAAPQDRFVVYEVLRR